MSDKLPSRVSFARESVLESWPVLSLPVAILAVPFIALAIAVHFGDSPQSQPATTTITVEHDGHRLIRTTTMFGVAVLHHPDCQCQTRAEK